MDNKSVIIIILISYLLYVLNNGSIVSILPLPYLLMFIVFEILEDKSYTYRLYYPIILTLLLSEGLLIIYIYHIKSLILNNPSDYGIFLLSLVSLIFISIAYIYYLFTGKYKNFPFLKQSKIKQWLEYFRWINSKQYLFST